MPIDAVGAVDITANDEGLIAATISVLIIVALSIARRCGAGSSIALSCASAFGRAIPAQAGQFFDASVHPDARQTGE